MKTYRDLEGDGGSNIVAQVQAQAKRLTDRLQTVRHKIAVMSGKGGVGKSSVTVNMASALAMRDLRVGILDADLNGPSIAKMTGVRDHSASTEPGAMRPAESKLGIKVMSMDFFLTNDNAPVMWEAPLPQQDAFTYRGLAEASTLRGLVSETEWGDLDMLFFDLPPGSGRLPDVEAVIPGLDGAVVVTIPAKISQLAVRKSISLAQKHLHTPLIGLVENMCGYQCPDCGEVKPLFPTGNVEALAASVGLHYMGGIPFDPRWAACADAGEPYLLKCWDSPAGRAIAGVADTLMDRLGEDLA